MHANLPTKLLLAGVAWFAAGAAAVACGGAQTLKLPGAVQRGVVHGDTLFAVTVQGNLLAIDLAGQAVKDLGNFGLKLGRHVGMVGPVICVASKDQLHLIDAAKGKLIRSLDCGQRIHGFGVLDGKRLYIQGAKTFAVLDIATGKTVCAVAPIKTAHGTDESRILAATLDASGNSLVCLLGGGQLRVGIVDLETGKLTETLPTSAKGSFEHEGDILVAGARAYVISGYYSYGIWMGRFGFIDLQTHKYQDLPSKLPRATMSRSYLTPGPNGAAYLTGPGCIYRCDRSGKIMSLRTRLQEQEHLAAVWQGQAVTINANTLRVVPLSAAVAASK